MQKTQLDLRFVQCRALVLCRLLTLGRLPEGSLPPFAIAKEFDKMENQWVSPRGATDLLSRTRPRLSEKPTIFTNEMYPKSASAWFRIKLSWSLTRQAPREPGSTSSSGFSGSASSTSNRTVGGGRARARLSSLASSAADSPRGSASGSRACRFERLRAHHFCITLARPRIRILREYKYKNLKCNNI